MNVNIMGKETKKNKKNKKKKNAVVSSALSSKIQVLQQ